MSPREDFQVTMKHVGRCLSITLITETTISQLHRCWMAGVRRPGQGESAKDRDQGQGAKDVWGLGRGQGSKTVMSREKRYSAGHIHQSWTHAHPWAITPHGSHPE